MQVDRRCVMLSYKAVYKGGQAQITEKKSRFIAHVAPVDSVEEAQTFIERIKKEYWDARHNCYAFSVGAGNPLNRFSDDGEPGGTAGKPILEVITGSEVRNIVIVVTRYFGGTLLGTGGLVRAYGKAAREGLEASQIIEKIPGSRVEVETNYTDMGKLQYLFASNDIVTESIDYTDRVLMHCLFPEERMEEMKKKIDEATSARAVTVEVEEVFFGNVEGEVKVFPR